jgi:hypothetical protein
VPAALSRALVPALPAPAGIKVCSGTDEVTMSYLALPRAQALLAVAPAAACPVPVAETISQAGRIQRTKAGEPESPTRLGVNPCRSSSVLRTESRIASILRLYRAETEAADLNDLLRGFERVLTRHSMPRAGRLLLDGRVSLSHSRRRSTEYGGDANECVIAGRVWRRKYGSCRYTASNENFVLVAVVYAAILRPTAHRSAFRSSQMG